MLELGSFLIFTYKHCLDWILGLCVIGIFQIYSGILSGNQLLHINWNMWGQFFKAPKAIFLAFKRFLWQQEGGEERSRCLR